MSLSSDRGQGEEEDAAGVDLQEAKISFPRLVRTQTANIPPEERANHVLFIQSTHMRGYVHKFKIVCETSCQFKNTLKPRM